MIDALPMSIGLEVGGQGGPLEVLLPRNASIPCSVTKRFELAEDDQPGITVEVFEGEDVTVARHNAHMGYHNFVVPRSIRRAHGGAGVIPVTFALDESGMLKV